MSNNNKNVYICITFGQEWAIHGKMAKVKWQSFFDLCHVFRNVVMGSSGSGRCDIGQLLFPCDYMQQTALKVVIPIVKQKGYLCVQKPHLRCCRQPVERAARGLFRCLDPRGTTLDDHGWVDARNAYVCMYLYVCACIYLCQ